MSQSFRSRADSPYPFRLQRPPPPRAKSVKINTEKNLTPIPLASIFGGTEKHDEISITPNPPLSTRYIDMLLQLEEEIPWLHKILAGISTWLLLAGYLVLPGAFTSIRNSRAISDGGKLIVKAVQKSLLGIAAACCVLAVSGMCWLWWRWPGNYIWVVNRIILPGLLNSIAGLITTVINIYTARSGFWSVTAIVTATVTGGCSAILMVLFLIYDTWKLGNIKKEHQRLKENAERRSVLESSGGTL